MALIKCPECNKEISDQATACPNCGIPIAQSIDQTIKVLSTQAANKKKKKGNGCLVAIIIFILFCIGFGLSINSAMKLEADRPPEETLSPEEEIAQIRQFDQTSWEDFKELYKAHSNLMKAMESFGNGQVSTLDFYNYCKDLESYFRSKSMSFKYGTSEEEKSHLSNLTSMALADQQVAKNLIKYLDSQKLSDLSKAQEEIAYASQSAVLFSGNRGILLQRAGYTEEELTQIIDAIPSELEAATSE